MSSFGHLFKLRCCFRRLIPQESSPTGRLCRVRFLRRQPCLTILSCAFPATVQRHTRTLSCRSRTPERRKRSDGVDNGPGRASEHLEPLLLAITRHRLAKSASLRRFELGTACRDGNNSCWRWTGPLYSGFWEIRTEPTEIGETRQGSFRIRACKSEVLWQRFVRSVEKHPWSAVR
jgi:hypothetical protein